MPAIAQAPPVDGTEVIVGAGVTGLLAEIIRSWSARRCLVVASAGTVGRVPVARLLSGFDAALFSDFTPNPQLADVLPGVRLAGRYAPDVIVAVGGGSALDVAKLIRLLPAGPAAARAALAGDPGLLRTSPAPMVAVPTTGGTGSEVTSFATVHIGATKHSLDDPRVRPDVALVDPAQLSSCPPALVATCALDTLAHAVESYWSVRSTPHSQALARSALTRVTAVLRRGRLDALTVGQREELARAALEAGLAIDITRTTAGHACAYPTTARFQVPHGLACALHLSWLLPMTAASVGRACRDARGPAFVRRRLRELAALLGAPAPDAAGTAMAGLVRRAGLPDRLGDHGIGPGDLAPLAAEGLASARAANHPVTLGSAAAQQWMRTRL